jgi:hypothetical protein
MVADVLLKVQERIEDISMDKYLQKKYRFEGSHNGVIQIPTVDGELWDLHAAVLADDLSPIAGSRTLFQHRLEQSQIASHAATIRRKLPKCLGCRIPKSQFVSMKSEKQEMRDLVTGRSYEWRLTAEDEKVCVSGYAFAPNERRAHQLMVYRNCMTKISPAFIARCRPYEAKLLSRVLLESKIGYGLHPPLDGRAAITSLEWIAWKPAARKMHVHSSTPKALRWSSTIIGVGWQSW